MRVDETGNSISIKRQQITSFFDQKFTKDYLLQADQINIGQIIEPQAESHPLDRRRWSEDPILYRSDHPVLTAMIRGSSIGGGSWNDKADEFQL
ncbi:hypothetical protein [Frankia sp. Cas3]|uniref:hypothetical protein n=1 Tax=Frankia sp. Cas3 TaxID=3073926 RepID=UPI002AD2C9DD|nr:hypothetical protein [Frankia sp. Cas3]